MWTFWSFLHRSVRNVIIFSFFSELDNAISLSKDLSPGLDGIRNNHQQYLHVRMMALLFVILHFVNCLWVVFMTAAFLTFSIHITLQLTLQCFLFFKFSYQAIQTFTVKLWTYSHSHSFSSRTSQFLHMTPYTHLIT